jgi:hypothetical protein
MRLSYHQNRLDLKTREPWGTPLTLLGVLLHFLVALPYLITASRIPVDPAAAVEEIPMEA